MKLTFKSEQYGTTVEINFEADTLDEIEEMYKQFLRGSGFHFEDEEDELVKYEKELDELRAFYSSDPSEKCVHETDISATADKSEISATADELREEIKRMQKFMSKPWVGLTDVEVGKYSDRLNGGDIAREVEAKLKEKNHG